MEYEIKKQAPDDLEERVRRLGDPAGKSMREIVEALGDPQRVSMGVKNVINNEPYMLMWFNKTFFCPFLFDLDYVCIGYEKELYEILNSPDCLS